MVSNSGARLEVADENPIFNCTLYISCVTFGHVNFYLDFLLHQVGVVILVFVSIE